MTWADETTKSKNMSIVGTTWRDKKDGEVRPKIVAMIDPLP